MRHALWSGVVVLGVVPIACRAPTPVTRGAPPGGGPPADAAVAVDASVRTVDAAPVDAPATAAPGPDQDGDQIRDAADACPTTAGAPSTDPARAGCPGLVELRGAQLVLREPIRFEIDKANIVPASLPVVDAIGDALRALGCELVEISGHRDHTPYEGYAVDITDRRAKSVAAALIKRGAVPAAMLVARGYGESKPLTLGKTDKERARNRRIEVRLLACSSLGIGP